LVAETQAPFKCAVCNKPIEGELSEKVFGDKALDFTLGDIHTGYACQNCAAVICYLPKKHLGMSLIKFGLFKGWKKVVCPVCGELLMPGKIVIKRASEYVDPETRKRLNQSYEYLRAEDLMNNTKKLRFLNLRQDAAAMFEDLLGRIERNPGYDADRQQSNVLALGRLLGVADPELRVPDASEQDVAKAKKLLLGVTEKKWGVQGMKSGYGVHREAWRMLIRLEAETGSRDLVPRYVEKMLDWKQVSHLRAAIAEELGQLGGDERVVAGLTTALRDTATRTPEEGATGLADLFKSLPSVAELAAASLKQLKDC
jgi:hypothetical protein